MNADAALRDLVTRDGYRWTFWPEYRCWVTYEDETPDVPRFATEAELTGEQGAQAALEEGSDFDALVDRFADELLLVTDGRIAYGPSGIRHPARQMGTRLARIAMQWADVRMTL